MSDAPGQPPVNYNAPNGNYPPAPGGDFPGKTLGIVGLVCAILFSVVGLIISIIANNQSKKAGFKNTPAFVGIIIGIITTVLGIIGIIVSIATLASISTQLNNTNYVFLGF
ncbi:putative membrane protein [Psychromicrobium silvestre]|uniref:Putative membrane protein n=1 Tax=Psychromicrobium silvestre TaxID=1645614 RepID=A0A7Y9S3Z5_9MICC|nr:hypothetical protein [Psychromicrobium silvestre]NYE94143.1 putative membrane protein [Psychromicrobium silvestre]